MSEYKFINKKVGIIGCPFNGGQHRNIEVDKGPKKLIEYGLLEQLQELGWAVEFDGHHSELRPAFVNVPKKRGPSKDYIEAIETRLQRIELIIGGLVQSGHLPKGTISSNLKCNVDEGNPISTQESNNSSSTRSSFLRKSSSFNSTSSNLRNTRSNSSKSLMSSSSNHKNNNGQNSNSDECFSSDSNEYSGSQYDFNERMGQPRSLYDDSENYLKTIQNESINLNLHEHFQLLKSQNPLIKESDERLIRKLYTKELIEVACKPLYIPNNSVFSVKKEKNSQIKSKFLKNAIELGLIKLIPYNEFEDQKEIGSGNSGNIYRAYWTGIRGHVAHKYLINSDDEKYWKAFSHELKMQSCANICENIIRILGVSYRDDRYLLIMEYASDGDLRNYLQLNSTLTFEEKLKLAFDITKGLDFLHKINIIHRDLHVKNIVIHEGKAKITDFGNSRYVDEQTRIHSTLFGILPYIAPELLSSLHGPHYTKASDIYSLGVLFWEIVSCRIPFKDRPHDKFLRLAIIDGERENRIDGIPKEYCEIYESCWDENPDSRPKIGTIYDNIYSFLNANDTNNDIDESSDLSISFVDINERSREITDDSLDGLTF